VDAKQLANRDGIVHHGAFLATNTELPRRAENGTSISAGRFEMNGDMAIDALT